MTPTRRDFVTRSLTTIAAATLPTVVVAAAIPETSSGHAEQIVIEIPPTGSTRPVTGVEWAEWYRASMKERFPKVELELEFEPLTQTVARVKTADDRRSLHFLLDGSGGMIHAVTMLSHDPIDFAALSTALSGFMLTMTDS